MNFLTEKMNDLMQRTLVLDTKVETMMRNACLDIQSPRLVSAHRMPKGTVQRLFLENNRNSITCLHKTKGKIILSVNKFKSLQMNVFDQVE